MFGYPGDGINGTFAALQRVEGRIAYVRVDHEEMAAFMAAVRDGSFRSPRRVMRFQFAACSAGMEFPAWPVEQCYLGPRFRPRHRPSELEPVRPTLDRVR